MTHQISVKQKIQKQFQEQFQEQSAHLDLTTFNTCEIKLKTCINLCTNAFKEYNKFNIVICINDLKMYENIFNSCIELLNLCLKIIIIHVKNIDFFDIDDKIFHFVCHINNIRQYIKTINSIYYNPEFLNLHKGCINSLKCCRKIINLWEKNIRNYDIEMLFL